MKTEENTGWQIKATGLKAGRCKKCLAKERATPEAKAAKAKKDATPEARARKAKRARTPEYKARRNARRAIRLSQPLDKTTDLGHT